MQPSTNKPVVEQGFAWRASRDHALDRLRTFVPNMADVYAAKRNFDFGPTRRDNVSLLSPWIRHRLILETEVLRTTLKSWPLDQSEKFVQEVFWRTYFKGWLEQFPQVWTRYQEDLQQLQKALGTESDLLARFERAIEGLTGIECFDFWVRELIEAGYLHNHARMWFASIWIFTLQLPWQLGAEFFYRHLLDGDPASNTLSWRWVAGLHTKGKIYLARADNISKFTHGRFAPAEGLATKAQALQEPDYGEAQSLSLRDAAAIDGDYGLLVTGDDCLPETLPLPRPPVAAMGLSRLEHAAGAVRSDRVLAFGDDAIDDALRRIEKNFDVPTSRGDGNDAIEHLLDWVNRLGITCVVGAYVPVGPVRPLMDEIRQRLADVGVKFVEIRRDYDAAAWPYAKRGFFGLKKKIPEIIGTLGLGGS